MLICDVIYFSKRVIFILSIFRGFYFQTKAPKVQNERNWNTRYIVVVHFFYYIPFYERGLGSKIENPKACEFWEFFVIYFKQHIQKLLSFDRS